MASPPAEPIRDAPARAGAALPLAASITIVSLLIAGGMLLALGTYVSILFTAALAGGTATAVAGGRAAIQLQDMVRPR